MYKIYGYPKCSTVRSALNFLNERNIEYEFQDFVVNRLTTEQIKDIHLLANVEIKKLFNTSGIKYRELQLKDKIGLMSLDECYELLATDGMLVKRPLLVGADFVLIGFKKNSWEEKI